MIKKNTLTLRIFFFCVLNDLVDSTAQVLMKKGLSQAGEGVLTLGNLAHVLLRGHDAYLVWLGTFLYALNFLIWIVILARLDLSTAVPVASTNYVILPVFAMIFLHEQVGVLRWAGIGLVILGIHFISKSTRSEPGEVSGP